LLIGIFQEQERQPAEVVAMQMADQYQIDRRRIDPLAFQRRQCRGPTVEQHGGAGAIDEITGLMAPGGRKGVAGAQE
jgi:hypothetical protein